MCNRMWSSRISAKRLLTPPRIAARSIKIVRALVTVSRRALDSGNPPAHAFDPRKRFLFFFRNFRKFILHKSPLG